jgi:hypothetical protein
MFFYTRLSKDLTHVNGTLLPICLVRFLLPPSPIASLGA